MNLLKVEHREEEMLIREGNICSWLWAIVIAGSILSRLGCYLKLTFSCVATFADPAPIAKDLSPAVFLIWVVHSPHHFFLSPSKSGHSSPKLLCWVCLLLQATNPLDQDLKYVILLEISPLSTSSSSNTHSSLVLLCSGNAGPSPQSHFIPDPLGLPGGCKHQLCMVFSIPLVQYRGHTPPYPEV